MSIFRMFTALTCRYAVEEASDVGDLRTLISDDTSDTKVVGLVLVGVHALLVDYDLCVGDHLNVPESRQAVLQAVSGRRPFGLVQVGGSVGSVRLCTDVNEPPQKQTWMKRLLQLFNTAFSWKS
eukprot:s5949_g1.t1